MAPVASRAPTSITGASSRPSPAPALCRDAAAGGRELGAAWAGQSEGHDGRADDAGDEGEPDPDRPEMGVDHQQAEAAVARTRPGCCAV